MTLIEEQREEIARLREKIAKETCSLREKNTRISELYSEVDLLRIENVRLNARMSKLKSIVSKIFNAILDEF